MAKVASQMLTPADRSGAAQSPSARGDAVTREQEQTPSRVPRRRTLPVGEYRSAYPASGNVTRKIEGNDIY